MAGRRRKLFAIASALVAAGAVHTPAADAAGVQPSDASGREPTFAVTMGSNEPLGHAIVELVAEMPEQRHVIEPVLSSMRATLTSRPVAVPGGPPFTLRDLNNTQRWLDMESRVRGSGLAEANGASQLLAIPEVTLLAASPTFQGIQTLAHRRCTTSGCTTVSTVSHQNIMDLYYVRYRSNARVTSSATGWSALSATATCRIESGSRPSCAGPDALSVQKLTYGEVYHNYDRLPSPGRFTVTFRGTYAGIPGSIAGNTPGTSCNTTTKTCTFV